MGAASAVRGRWRKVGKWMASVSVFVGLSCATGLFASQQASSAATTPTPSVPGTVRAGRGAGKARPGSPSDGKSVIDRRIEILTKQLDLNDVQKFDARKILESGQEQASRLWSDQQIAPIERMTKLRKLREESQKQFRAVLTEEQRKKYDEYLQRAPQAAGQASSASAGTAAQQDSGKTDH